MSSESYQHDNPYASPDDPCPPGIDRFGRFEPIRSPADLLDAALFFTRAMIILAVFFGTVGLIALVVDWLFPSNRLVLLGVCILAAIVMQRFASVEQRQVTSASIDEIGLHFHRERLPPDDWPWQNILSIRLAPRWEVAWYGWFRPLFKPRDPTACNSALGHYRIQGKTDYYFFPPRNPEAFVEAIARYCPDLLNSAASEQPLP